MSKNTNLKPAQPKTPASLLKIAVAMLDADPVKGDTKVAGNGKGIAAQTVGTDSIRMGRLVEAGVVQVNATLRHRDENGEVKRGRPMNLYALTSKGRARAKRAAQDTPVEA